MIDGVWAVLIELGAYLFGAIIFGLVGWSWWKSRKEGRNKEQLKELVRFAKQRGWRYADSAKSKNGRYFTGKAAEEVKVYDSDAHDFITGTFRGRSFRCFERRHRSVNADGPNSTLINATFELELPMAVPYTTIKRRRPLDTTEVRLFGGSKVVKLGDPEFDEAFRVIGHDEEFARQVLSGGLAHFLVSDPRAQHEPLRLDQNILATSYRGRLRVEQVEAKLNYLCDVLDRLPMHTEGRPG
ncbi:hypothetical protein ACFVFQ_18540 [Streptomyces sp. NPDC057743]|uniref:hypothetical protein n=1 Tax=Streptomyces sp. NPDC057743 TaxID=3346236 RepID=UPI0036B81A06